MTRSEAAAAARLALTEKRRKTARIEREIVSLRNQVGRELAKQTSSGLNVHLGDIDEEYVPELRNLRARTRIFERMANDPVVRGQIRAITMTLISGVRWKVEGGRQEQQDLVAGNLLREGPKRFWCATSWLDRLQETLGCLIYGFALFAKTREIVEGKVIFRELKWLHPRSVDEDGWIMDDADNLLEVRRSYTTGGGKTVSRQPIPAADLFLVPWDRRGPNWEGNAFIRPMYKPWKLRELAEKINIIDLQNRGIGIPVAHLSGAGGGKERDTLVSILKGLRGGSKERAFIVLEKDEKVGYLLSEGQARDAQSTLDTHRMDIAKSAGTEYFEQGNTATGSRAGASALATGFFINVDAVRILLEDMINFGAGPMPGLSEELQDMSFENIKEYARIVGSRVSPTEQLDNIPLVGDSIQKGAITKDIAIENEVRRRLGYPVISQEDFERLNQGPPISLGGRPNEAGPDAQGRDDDESSRLASRALAEKKTSGASRPTRSPASWRWLSSTRA